MRYNEETMKSIIKYNKGATEKIKEQQEEIERLEKDNKILKMIADNRESKKETIDKLKELKDNDYSKIEEDKKIEKLEEYSLDKDGKYEITPTLYEQILKDKINEIIDYINKENK